ncbi:hypothetical protein SGGMMB4_00773 [Sodalis glossinidius str. 'morsitans']|nr:hypothetical protein [Sodalis glossinidius]CRL43976.1 hypothetical protein SGGMMB4_00773 [Sodalis glossinidius str. 'morsitans']
MNNPLRHEVRALRRMARYARYNFDNSIRPYITLSRGATPYLYLDRYEMAAATLPSAKQHDYRWQGFDVDVWEALQLGCTLSGPSRRQAWYTAWHTLRVLLSGRAVPSGSGPVLLSKLLCEARLSMKMLKRTGHNDEHV